MERYVVYSKVRKVEKAVDKHYLSGIGPDAIFEDRPMGYYLYLEGSYEAIYLGHEEPKLKPGDKIKITFEKVET